MMTESETLKRYGDLVKRVAQTIFPPHPYGREDLEQVGMLALLRAAESWEVARGVPFEAYARILIRRDLIDAARSWSHTIQGELVASTSLDGLSHTDDLLASYDDETVVELRELLGRLSPQQRYCLVGRLAGLRTAEIGAQLGVNRSRVSQIISSIRVAA